jgi:hypothetical protein
MVIICQIGSALTGLVAAILWFIAAASKTPPATWNGIDKLPAYLDQASRLNKWAAGFTGVSMVLSAGATVAAIL